MVLGWPGVVGRIPGDLGEKQAYLHYLLLLSRGSGNTRHGLLSSVEWRDVRHPAAFFLQSWGSLTSSTFQSSSLSLVIVLNG